MLLTPKIKFVSSLCFFLLCFQLKVCKKGYHVFVHTIYIYMVYILDQHHQLKQSSQFYQYRV